jgi:hypothetical protein
MNTLHVVITTIQRPTAAVKALAELPAAQGATLVIIGDRKGPDSYPLPSAVFLDLAQQLRSPYELARALPLGHYARKNIGYLQAVNAGAGCIYETDDDNAPLAHWQPREESVHAVSAATRGWCNVYRHFTGERIWPRGLPLNEIVSSVERPVTTSAQSFLRRAPIQQGLANNSPDVDAVWRLVLDRPFNFNDAPSIYLQPGVWCPFNSQTTWWWPVAYPLLYLPSHCSFRMTDIWRSFIAQRCLWELEMGVVFHAPEVTQDRNPHDLMRDFHDEIPGYENNQKLIATLECISLKSGVEGVAGNLRRCYEALISAGIFPEEEMKLVDLWIQALK